MSRKYKMINPNGIYFISFAVINWIDVFVRERYQQVIAESLNYCIRHKSMVLYSYCIMPSHIHMVFRDGAANPSKLIKEFKTFTSKQMQKEIINNYRESRREWMLEKMRKAAASKVNVQNYQFWQQNNHPKELWSKAVLRQKINYIHYNPVKAGFTKKPQYWFYSSAQDYIGLKGPVEITVARAASSH